MHLHNNYENMNKDLSSVASSLYDNDSFYVLPSIAYLTEIVTAKTSLHCKKNCLFLCYSYMSFASNYTYQAKISYPCSLFFLLPSQKVMFPLQFPVDKHCLIFDPRRLKPSSHINCTFCGYVVILPNKYPFVGALSIPQSFAVDVE